MRSSSIAALVAVPHYTKNGGTHRSSGAGAHLGRHTRRRPPDDFRPPLADPARCRSGTAREACGNGRPFHHGRRHGAHRDRTIWVESSLESPRGDGVTCDVDARAAPMAVADGPNDARCGHWGCPLSLLVPARRSSWVGGRSRPAPAGVSRPFSDPDHPLTPKGAIGWSGSVQGLKQQGRDESGAESAEEIRAWTQRLRRTLWGPGGGEEEEAGTRTATRANGDREDRLRSCATELDGANPLSEGQSCGFARVGDHSAACDVRSGRRRHPSGSA